jgi:glutathione-regulated potassium-efflux system ancillary protein KefF
MLVIISAHPYPDRSRANRILLAAVEDLAGVEIRSLYDLYPGFDIDVQSEQQALAGAEIIVWQHPIYWYSPPGLLKHWFDKVLARGWAYGEGGTALRGKRCLWVATTGAEPDAYRPEGMHGHPFQAFVPVVEQTARFCGMAWEPPIVLHGVHRARTSVLERAAADYRARLAELMRVARREPLESEAV